MGNGRLPAVDSGGEAAAAASPEGSALQLEGTEEEQAAGENEKPSRTLQCCPGFTSCSASCCFAVLI